MTIREATIAKLQQLPEPLLKQVSDFIDLLTERKQRSIEINNPEGEPSKAWARWFESVDQLEFIPTKPASDYQQLLLSEAWEHGVRREVKRNKELRDNPSVSELYAAIRTKMAIEDVLQDGGKVYIKKKDEKKPKEWKPRVLTLCFFLEFCSCKKRE